MSGVTNPASIVGKVKDAAKKHPTATAAVLNHIGALVDANSSRAGFGKVYGWHEANPALKPFSHSGIMYPAMQVTPVLEDLLALTKHKKLARGLMRGEALSHYGCSANNWRQIMKASPESRKAAQTELLKALQPKR